MEQNEFNIDINNKFDLQNPNSGYSNPQIPLQSIRGINFRGESNNVPSNPKKGDIYFDLDKGVIRTFTSQLLSQADLTSFNTWVPGFNYLKGNYVLATVLGVTHIYQCTVDHTSALLFTTDLTAGKRVIETAIINRWQPEYGNFYCNASQMVETVSDGVLHQVVLDTYDTNNGFAYSNIHRLTIAENGLYDIKSLVKFSSGIQDRHIWIYKNGVALQDISIDGDYYYYEDSGGVGHTIQIAKTQTLQLNIQERCEKNDIIDIYVRQNSGGDLTVDSFLQVYRRTW